MSEQTTSQESEVLKGLLRRLVEERAFWQAQVIARRLVEIVQDDGEVWYLYGRVNARLGELDAAVDCLGKALDIAGPRVPIAVELCYVDEQKGDYRSAVDWCRRGLELEPANVDLHQEIARLHVLLDEPDEAVQVLEICLRMPGLDPEEEKSAKEQLAHILMNLRRYDHALVCFRMVAEADAENDSVWANIGHCLSRQGKEGEAIEAFERAVRIRPDAHNLYNLGDAFLANGQPDKAVEHLKGAVQIKPDHAMARYDLGLAYFELGRFQEAEAESRAALAADPDMVTAEINLGINANLNLGLSLTNQERYEEAIQCFKKNEKKFAATYFNMGLALFRAKRHREALDYFKRACAIEPDEAEFLDLLGQTYTEVGNYPAAEKHLRRSIELGPDEYWGYYDLGNLFLRIKDKRKEARTLLEKAIELGPDFMWSYYCLGCWYAFEGKKTEAFEYLEKAVEKGLKDKEWVEADKDLESLRADRRYAKLVQKLVAGENRGHNTNSPIPEKKRNGQGGAGAKTGEGKKKGAGKPAPKEADKVKKAKKAAA